MKTGVWTKLVFKKNCCSWLRWCIMVENTRREIDKKDQGKTDAPTMTVRPALKQPEKNAQRDLLLLWKGGASQVGLPSGI